MQSPTIEFSVVIPAFNEKGRLPVFLSSLVEEINKSGLNSEIILVDDGSKEENGKAYFRLLDSFKNIDIKILRHKKNRGKGAAIQTGFNSAKGSWVGFVDADGATPAQEVVRLLKIAASSGGRLDGVFGARIRMLGCDIYRHLSRHLFGRIFVTLAYVNLHIPIYDPQCGCKFFRKSRILPFLKICKEEGYLFDIELISIGYLNGLNFVEVPISWRDIPLGKVQVFRDGLKMIIGLSRIRRRLSEIGIVK